MDLPKQKPVSSSLPELKISSRLSVASSNGADTLAGNGGDRPRNIVVFSGGSAANNLVDLFLKITEDKRCQLSYIIPISDNGGSSSELIRVFGGPGIGDIRSRLVRLIPQSSSPESIALRVMFNHRLSEQSDYATQEWHEVVDGRHVLWTAISSSRKELIRPFFNLLNMEIVKRARPSSKFNFSHASIGNMFLTGAQLFTGSLESSIELLTLVCGVNSSTRVLPGVNTNHTLHICAGLADGSEIVGQNDISHPSAPTALPDVSSLAIKPGEADKAHVAMNLLDHHDAIEDANLPGSLPSLRGPNIAFKKDNEADLPSRIARVWYINPYGHEVRLAANPKVLEALKASQCLVYSIGSLYTSLIPNLVLKGVGEAIANSPLLRKKVLILNGTIDRETGPSSEPFDATDFVAAIAQACWESQGKKGIVPLSDYKRYVTHVLYLESQVAPAVDKAELRTLGIEPSKISGQSTADGTREYDQVALGEALSAHIAPLMASRRNTLSEKKQLF